MPLVLAGNISRSDEVKELLKDRKYRKATLNMVLAFSAVQRALLEIQDIYDKIPETRRGIFIGSCHGELETTIQFLKHLFLSDRARPIFFQNGLHNAMLGFLSRELDVKGVGVTQSNGFFSGEDALDQAIDFLNLKKVDLAIVVGVDGIPQDISTSFNKIYSDGVSLIEGAGCLILVREEENNSNKCLGSIKKIDFNYSNTSIKEKNFENFYASNAIELILGSLNDHSKSAEYLLRVDKPDGRSSEIHISKEKKNDF